MKLILLSIGIAASSFTSCKEATQKASDTLDRDTINTEIPASEVKQDSATLKAVLAEYIRLKNALVSGKPGEAGAAATTMIAALDSLHSGLMTDSQRKVFIDNRPGATDHAQQIATNKASIKNQREHFSKLSESIYRMVKGFGTTETLYKDYCPMKKAIWLSETKPVRNPYYGNEMLSCGEVQETIQE
jgi:Protein of unknown function (DUF3347)